MDNEKTTSPNTGLQRGHGPTIRSGPDTFCPRPLTTMLRYTQPQASTATRLPASGRAAGGSCGSADPRFPTPAMEPKRRRRTPVEYSGSAFVPLAVFLRDGARQRVPRRSFPPSLAVALGGPGPAALRASRRRAAGSPGWRPHSSRMKPSIHCTPAPAMAAAKRQCRCLPYTLHLWFPDQDPFKAEGYTVP